MPRDVRLASRRARRSAPRTASGCRPRSSGRRPREAATTGSGRGATSCPTRRARPSARGIGGPSPVGLRPAGASPCGALDLAGNVWEWTTGRRRVARGGSYLHGPDELRCSARQPMHPGARDHLRRLPRRRPSSRAGLRLGRRARRRRTRSAATRARRGQRCRRRRTPSSSRGRPSRTRSTRPSWPRAAPTLRPHWPRARTTIPSPSSTGTTRPPSARGPAAGCRPRPSGRRPRAAPTGARYPWGDDGRPVPRRGRRRHQARRHVAGRRAPGRREPVRSARHGRQRLGVDVDRRPVTPRRPARRARAPRRLVREPGPRLGRCAMRSRSRPGRRQSHIGFRVARGGVHERRREPAARPHARARRGREPDRRHGRRRAPVRAAGCEELGIEVEVLDDVFPRDADRRRRG